MKNAGCIFLLGLLCGVNTWAGQGTCPNSKLTCSVVYNLAPKEPVVAGPIDKQMLTDRQPEPFDPADCAADTVLYTYGGAVYNSIRYSNQRFYPNYEYALHSSLYFDGARTEIASYQVLVPGVVYSAEIPIQLKGDVKSMTLSCLVSQ